LASDRPTTANAEEPIRVVGGRADPGLLTRQIGNPSLSGVEPSYRAITEPRLDHDYFLMTTYWQEQQPSRFQLRRNRVLERIVDGDLEPMILVDFAQFTATDTLAKLLGTPEAGRAVYRADAVQDFEAAGCGMSLADA
jgi:hypothetical protein